MAPAGGLVLITGADGFVGSVLCRKLSEAGFAVRRAVRKLRATDTDPAQPTFAAGDIGPDTDWKRALSGVACVVHLAARTHVLRETATDPLAEYRRVNVLGTETLARAAAAQGVRRFVFLSSVKVNGESTEGRPFKEEDAPRPEDAYGISKWEAEQVLRRIAAETGLEVVVLRAPLVYGPGVKGNFLRLMNWVAHGMPLPLASVHDRRSLIHVGNLVDAIIAAVNAPQPIDQTYLVSDGEDISTPELIRGIAHALGKPARLFPFPPVLLKFAGAAIGKSGAVSRLLGSLQVDSGKIRRELGWRPRCDMAHGLRETAEWYRRKVMNDSVIR